MRTAHLLAFIVLIFLAVWGVPFDSNKLKTVEPPYLLFKVSIEIFFKVKNIHN